MLEDAADAEELSDRTSLQCRGAKGKASERAGRLYQVQGLWRPMRRIEGRRRWMRTHRDG